LSIAVRALFVYRGARVYYCADVARPRAAQNLSCAVTGTFE
jgi:hypothetical protein